MSVNSYLKKFRSSLPSTQGNQILSRLISKKDQGEIRTVDEFRRHLKQLTEDLLQTTIKPSFTLLKAVVGKDISPDQWNEMLKRIQDDLETGFGEADTIEEILTSHHNIIQEIALKTIRYGLNELESKINFYELLVRTTYGFDSSLFNTFREAKNISTPRSEIGLLYIDPRNLSEVIDAEEDASVDLNGERLTLGLQSISYAPPAGVEWLSNIYSSHGEVEVLLENSDISNIIDGQTNTYWLAPILFSEPRNGGAYIEVSIRVPSFFQDINFIEINPVSSYAVILEQVDYIDNNGLRNTAYDIEVDLDKPVKIYFGRISAKSIILRFRQDNYNEIQFKISPTVSSNFYKALAGEKVLQVDLNAVSKSLQNVLSSNFILSDLLNTNTNTGTMNRYYQYLFGFDNIRPGYTTYSDRSIFVSNAYILNQPCQIGLKILETRPTQVIGSSTITQSEFNYPTRSSTEDNKFYHGSLEYWLGLKSYTSSGYLIATDFIPTFPLNATRIYHERLILTHKSSSSLSYEDMGSFMFFTDASSSDVYIYRNGALIAYGTDWEFVDQATNSEITYVTPNNGTRMKRGIKINLDINPLDIYTVSYTPKISNSIMVPQAQDTLADIIDLTGDYGFRLVKNNIIAVSKTRKSFIVDRIEAYLIVILRRNSAKEHLTPALEEFTILGSSRESTKLIKDF